MKRAFAVLCMALLLAPAVAHAKWVTKEIFWKISNVGAPTDQTGIYVRDTSKVVIAGSAGNLDTTSVFTLDDADPIPRGVQAPGITSAGTTAPSDTTVLGWILLQSDSSAAPTATLESLTGIIEGRVIGTGPATTLARGWVKADSVLVSTAAGGTLNPGMESVGIPIRSISPYGNVSRWPQLRFRTTTGTGILGAVRAFLRYWDNDAPTRGSAQ